VRRADRLAATIDRLAVKGERNYDKLHNIFDPKLYVELKCEK
jgi:hypothetical protein